MIFSGHYIKKIQELPYNEKLTRDVVRVAMSSVSELIVDKQFRIQLPKEVIERYKISKEKGYSGIYSSYQNDPMINRHSDLKSETKIIL